MKEGKNNNKIEKWLMENFKAWSMWRNKPSMGEGDSRIKK